MILFVVATAIMALALSPCFGQVSGAGTSCWADFERLPRCTPDSCRRKCVSLGLPHFTTNNCDEFEGVELCCCTFKL
ncbi:hypothetical protein PVAP13_5NG469500 [Panicum virgatum]|nr:hypothetical protein PVAP13_5NG469500 [Panicum virgatum]